MELLAATASSDHGIAHGFIVVGLFLLVGFAVHILGRKIHVPRVTFLLLLGFLASPSVLHLVPETAADWFPLAARFALSIIGFQLGEEFLGKKLRQTGRTVLLVSLTEVIVVTVVVFLVLLGVGNSLSLALLMAAVAPASAPAATFDVIRESGAKGPVTDTVLGVVAIDDAWGVILFSFLLVFVQMLTHQEASMGLVWSGLREVVGGVLLGALVGLPMAFLAGAFGQGN